MSRLFIAMRWKRVIAVALSALLVATFASKNELHAQSSDPVPSGAVASSEFLRSVASENLTNRTTNHPFPIGPFAAPVLATQADSQLAPAADDASANSPITRATATAEYPATAEYQGPVQESSQIVGSGIANASMPQAIDDPRPIYSPEITTRIPHAGSMATGAVRSAPTPRAPWKLKNGLGIDPNRPNLLVGYEVMHLRRSNDSGGDVSQGGDFGRMDAETAGRYSVARLLGVSEQVEFVFTGPFHWGRDMSIPGPVDSNLDFGNAQASHSSALNAADEHRQSHRIQLASYEVNRRTSSDGMSSYLAGLRILDHSERYHLGSTKGTSTGDFRLSTHNVLAGGQVGLSLSRPLSQRFSIGASMSLGAFVDFASGSFEVLNNSAMLAEKSDTDLRVTWMAQPCGFLNYRITENSVLYAGYEGWYFTRLATSADQRPGNVMSTDSFALRTRDDQLFYGWTAGISAKF